jgi:hypothetical protein
VEHAHPSRRAFCYRGSPRERNHLGRVEVGLWPRNEPAESSKDKLSGASPDEAKALINNLEQQLTNLKGKVEPRRLTEEQRRLIMENATLPEGTTYRISIQNELGSDTTEYAGDFDNALRQTPGWQVRRFTFPPMPTFAPTAHGVLIVATPRNFGTPEILSIRRALDAASVTYEFASHPAVSGNADVFLLIRPRRTCP